MQLFFKILGIVACISVASLSKAVVVDGRSDRVLYVEKRDGLIYFHRCIRLEGVLSSCNSLNAEDGLALEDFQPLLDTLQRKSDMAAVSNARISAVTFVLVGSTAVSTLLLLRSLSKREIVRMFGCCSNKHHHSNLLRSVRALMPKVYPRRAMNYLFKEKTWIVPSILAQSSAAIAAHASAESAADKLSVYQFLHSEIMNIGTIDSENTVLQVRSVATIEFMIYEAIRLKRQAAKHHSHEKQASTGR